MGLRAHDNDGSQKTKSKWMWGCCGGCAGIGVVAAIGLGIFIYWMVRSQPVVPPETFFRKQSDALAVIQLRPEHHHVAEFLQQMAQDPPEGLDMTSEQKKRLKSRSGDIPSQLASLTPLQVVLSATKLDSSKTIRNIPEGDPWEFIGDIVGGIGDKKRFDIGYAASMKAYSGAIGWTLSGMIDTFVDRGGYKEQYENVDIGVPPDENFHLAVVSNNVLLAEDRNVVTGWVDELHRAKKRGTSAKQGETGFRGPAVIKNVYENIDPKAPLIFATSNHNGEIDAFLSAFQEALSSDENNGATRMSTQIIEVFRASGLNADDVEALGGYINMESANAATIHLLAECDATGTADQIAAGLIENLPKLGGIAQNNGFEVTTEGTMARVAITVENLEQAFRNVLRQGTGQAQPQGE